MLGVPSAASTLAPHQLTATADSITDAEALDGHVICLAHYDWITSRSSGPCDGFIPPTKVAVGADFTANGKRRQIRFMRADQGSCTAAETEADLDVEHREGSLWLYIPKCRPLRADST